MNHRNSIRQSKCWWETWPCFTWLWLALALLLVTLRMCINVSIYSKRERERDTYIHIVIYVYIYTCPHTQIHNSYHIYIYIYSLILFIFTYAHAHTHTHTHTHYTSSITCHVAFLPTYFKDCCPAHRKMHAHQVWSWSRTLSKLLVTRFNFVTSVVLYILWWGLFSCHPWLLLVINWFGSPLTT